MLTAPDPFVLAVAAIVFRGDRVLALRRSRHRDAGAGLWETISGRVERDEDLVEAVRREALEETGLAIDVDPRPVDAYTMTRGDAPMVLVLYRGRSEEGEVALSAEHDAYAWCTPSEFAAKTTLDRLARAVERAAREPR
jgi:8-oxo-dGTP pyrophosphatase MutT (NUDIX family)